MLNRRPHAFETMPIGMTKDCACADHEGPHWLHEVWLMERANLATLQGAIDAGGDLAAAADQFFWAEFARKNNLIHQMTIRGIDAIPADLIPPLPPLRYPCDRAGRPHPVIERLADLMGWPMPEPYAASSPIQRALF